mgnify:FL=1
MMKINEAFGSNTRLQSTAAKDGVKITESKNKDFRSNIQHIEIVNSEERLKDLAAKIIEQGEKLGKKIDIRELKIYKNLLAEFMDEAVGKSLRFSKESFIDRRGRHKMYAIIKKINADIDEITSEILKSERDNIKILQKIDDIRGMKLDILM